VLYFRLFDFGRPRSDIAFIGRSLMNVRVMVLKTGSIFSNPAQCNDSLARNDYDPLI
jgi:hypothetical protein